MLQCVSLFSGAGGFCEGFKLAGWKVLCAVEGSVLQCVSLFSGAGGFCEGFKLAGWKVLCGRCPSMSYTRS